MSYGTIRLRLQKQAPGTDLELLDGWIQDVYTEILDRLPWKRSEADIVIQAPVSYATGTVTVTQGVATITGAGTVWTAGMTGLAIRFDNQETYYQFTDVNATSATLDRPYEGVDGTEVTYRIDQPVYVMPANARQIRSVVPMHDRTRPLEMITPAELDRISISRNTYGTPKYAVAHWDSFANPPRMQIELYPIPQSPTTNSAIPSWAVEYVFDRDDLDPEATSTSLLPWVRPAALIDGVMAKIRRHAGDLKTSVAHFAEHTRLVGIMAQINAEQRGAQTIRLAEELQFKKSQRSGPNPFQKVYPDPED